METKSTAIHPGVIPFKRKKWCVFCTIYSIPFRPGLYVGTTRSNSISLASNNPNEIFREMKRSLPSPMVRAMDTDGLGIDEAIAWHRVTKADLSAEIDSLQQSGYEKITLPQSVSELIGLPDLESTSNNVVTAKRSGFSPNSFFGALLFRLFTSFKFLMGYAIPFLIPFLIIKPSFILPILVTFCINLFMASLIWPFIQLKSWIKGILLGLFSGAAYSLVTYFVLPQYFHPGISVTAVIIGLLIGFLFDCTDRDDQPACA